MARAIKQFRVFDNSGNLIMEGTAKECSERIGICDSTFRDCAERSKRGGYGKYRIVQVSEDAEKEISKDVVGLIKQWDDFVTPIREKYGVPVYRGKEKKDDKI